MKNTLLFIVLFNVLTANSQVASDIVISSFEKNTTGETGVSFSNWTTTASKLAEIPNIGINPKLNGVNTSAYCGRYAIVKGNDYNYAGLTVNFNRPITKAERGDRRYLKIMVCKSPNYTFRFYLNQTTYTGTTTAPGVGTAYNGAANGEWLWSDIVIDLAAPLNSGSIVYADSTLQSLRIYALNGAATSVTTNFNFDNIVLSNDPAPRPICDPEIKQLQDRLYNDANELSIPDTINFYYNSQLADGSWSNIDYASRVSVYWPGVDHLKRVRAMAKLYAMQPDSTTALSRKLRNGVIQGLLFWETKKPVSDNWFYNDIGKQQEFAPILLLARSYLPQPLVTAIGNYLVIAAANNTGANLMAMAQGEIVRGAMLGNLSYITDAVTKMSSVVEIMAKNTDGIQADNSFIFHGYQLFAQNYNTGIVSGAAKYIKLTEGLSFAFPSKYIANIRNVMLGSNRWFIWKDMIDYNTNGRVISMPKRNYSKDYRATLNALAQCDTTYADSYQYILQNAENALKDTLTGNRMFYRAKFMAHRRADFYIGIKMFSSAISGMETGNGQNLKGFWLPFGATTIYRTGNEFKDIFPLWDWTKIPGTTTANEIPGFGWSLYQNATFVGGVSDTRCGVSTMQIDKQSILARKSWFMFDNEVVAMGSGITATNANNIFTTLAQSFLRNDVLVNGNIIPKGSARELTGVNTVLHDSIGYIFPNPTNVKILNTTKSGTWYNISTAESKDTIRGEVFNLWIDHGIKPTNANYAYIVVPNATNDKLAEYNNQSTIKILSNTADIQAVTQLNQRMTGIVFHTAGSLVVDNRFTFKAYQPCAVLIDHSGSKIHFTVSDPGETSTTGKFELIYSNAPTETFSITMPTGNNTGASVIVFANTPITSGLTDTKTKNTGIIANTPINEKLIFNTEDTIQSGDIRMVGMDGKIVFACLHSVQNGTELALPAYLKSGIYLLQVVDNNSGKNYTQRVQKL